MFFLMLLFLVICMDSFRYSIEHLFAFGSIVFAENFELILGSFAACAMLNFFVSRFPRSIIQGIALLLTLISCKALFYPVQWIYHPFIEAFRTRFEQLNSLELIYPFWQQMLTQFSSFTIASGFTFIIHEVVYFGAWIPYLLMDQFPMFQRYKIQPVSIFSPSFIFYN